MEQIKIIVQSDGQNITPFLKIGEKEYQGMNFRDNDTVMSSVVFVSENIISNLITLGFKGLVFIIKKTILSYVGKASQK